MKNLRRNSRYRFFKKSCHFLYIENRKRLLGRTLYRIFHIMLTFTVVDQQTLDKIMGKAVYPRMQNYIGSGEDLSGDF